MRFVLYIIYGLVICLPAYAAPGDKLSVNSNWSDKPARKIQYRPNSAPIAPEGFKLSKIVANLGKVNALAVINNDIFVADAEQNRVIRLRSRSGTSQFDNRADYLVGFNEIQDLAADGDRLFMADRDGVWEIVAGNTLIATDAPKLLYTTPSSQREETASLAVIPKADAVIVGSGNQIVAIDLLNNKHRIIARGPWQIQDVTVSPNGSVWASVVERGVSYIFPIRASNGDAKKMAIPENLKITDIQFWAPDTYPEDWPRLWASDLLFSVSGSHPMIARAHFNYGDLDPEFTILVDGFSNPSRFVGVREYWGSPSAIDTLGNGQLIFSEQEQGTLWVLKKDDNRVDRVRNTNPKQEIPTPKTPGQKKPGSPTIIRGSSIESASSLETDELLRKSTQPDQDKPNNGN